MPCPVRNLSLITAPLFVHTFIWSQSQELPWNAFSVHLRTLRCGSWTEPQLSHDLWHFTFTYGTVYTFSWAKDILLVCLFLFCLAKKEKVLEKYWRTLKGRLVNTIRWGAIFIDGYILEVWLPGPGESVLSNTNQKQAWYGNDTFCILPFALSIFANSLKPLLPLSLSFFPAVRGCANCFCNCDCNCNSLSSSLPYFPTPIYPHCTITFSC